MIHIKIIKIIKRIKFNSFVSFIISVFYFLLSYFFFLIGHLNRLLKLKENLKEKKIILQKNLADLQEVLDQVKLDSQVDPTIVDIASELPSDFLTCGIVVIILVLVVEGIRGL